MFTALLTFFLSIQTADTYVGKDGCGWHVECGQTKVACCGEACYVDRCEETMAPILTSVRL